MAASIRTVKTDAFSMDYFQFGHGRGTLAILPGLSVQSVTAFAESVAGAYQPMTDDYTVYVFDRRREMPGAYSMRDMARDTAAAFRALGLGRTDIFGASQGGMIAMLIAMEHPECVRRLALGSASARVDRAQFQTIERWIELAKGGNALDLYLAFGEAIYPREVFEAARGLLTEAAGAVTEGDLKRFVIQAEALRDFDVSDALESIKCPTLVIGSEDDRVLGAEASEEIAKRLNGRAELFLYDGFGHAAYDLAPDYKSRLLRFLLSDE